MNKYLIAAGLTVLILSSSFGFGWFSRGEIVRVVPPKCSEFRRYVVTGAETDKVIEKYRVKKLCAA